MDFFRREGYYAVRPKILKKLEDKLMKSKGRLSEKFKRELARLLTSEYRKFSRRYRLKKESIEKKWRKIEEEFFIKSQKIVGKKWGKNYFCYFTPFGMEGSYLYPNKIFVMPEQATPGMIAHELLHLLIYRTVENKIKQTKKERLVDLYINKTPLHDLFKEEKMQKIKEKAVDRAFERNTKIKDIIEKIS
jgi:hypothetical protein